jgi:hypothetical protein
MTVVLWQDGGQDGLEFDDGQQELDEEGEGEVSVFKIHTLDF